MRIKLTASAAFLSQFILSLLVVLLLIGNSSASAQPANTNANPNTNLNTNVNANTNTNTNTTANRAASGNANVNPGSLRSLPPCPSAEEYAQVRVVRAFKKTAQGEETTAELGDEITVEVEGLQVLMAKAQCANPVKNILLFLDGRPVKDATPFPPTDPGQRVLIFPLKRTENSRAVWAHILGDSKWTPRPTVVSIGLEDEYAVNSSAAPINLIVIPHGWFFFWAIIFLLLLGLFLVLAHKSNLLRDSGPDPAGANERKPYSLARTQAAWWFFLVLASYLFIGMITGDFSTTITSTVLGLMGISAGTVVGSAVIDAGKPDVPSATYVPKNEYWWVDILSDADGVSFHRFQVAAWTFVLGIIFIIEVYRSLAMPTFNGTLLALLGISAGTYLGLKIPEPTTPTK